MREEPTIKVRGNRGSKQNTASGHDPKRETFLGLPVPERANEPAKGTAAARVLSLAGRSLGLALRRDRPNGHARAAFREGPAGDCAPPLFPGFCPENEAGPRARASFRQWHGALASSVAPVSREGQTRARGGQEHAAVPLEKGITLTMLSGVRQDRTFSAEVASFRGQSVHRLGRQKGTRK